MPEIEHVNIQNISDFEQIVRHKMLPGGMVRLKPGDCTTVHRSVYPAFARQSWCRNTDTAGKVNRGQVKGDSGEGARGCPLDFVETEPVKAAEVLETEAAEIEEEEVAEVAEVVETETVKAAEVGESHICPKCGGEFKSKAGLTSHVKSCEGK